MAKFLIKSDLPSKDQDEIDRIQAIASGNRSTAEAVIGVVVLEPTPA